MFRIVGWLRQMFECFPHFAVEYRRHLYRGLGFMQTPGNLAGIVNLLGTHTVGQSCGMDTLPASTK